MLVDLCYCMKQDSEEGCEEGYESGKQRKVTKRSEDKFGEVWMERFGHRSPKWIINLQGEAGVEGKLENVGKRKLEGTKRWKRLGD